LNATVSNTLVTAVNIVVDIGACKHRLRLVLPISFFQFLAIFILRFAGFLEIFRFTRDAPFSLLLFVFYFP